MALPKVLQVLLLLALLVAASAQSYTADDARQLGTPDSNYCRPLCNEVIKRNSSYAKMFDFCKNECVKCVDEVSKAPKGAPLPAACQTAYKFKEVPQVISDFLQGKISAQKGKP